MMAGLAMGSTMRHRVSAWVAPSASEPWRMVLGIRASPSSVETITTGRVRMARVRADQMTPGEPKVGLGSASG